MAIVDLDLVELRVGLAGEDGADGDAEWRLSFEADGADWFRFADNAVEDGEVFPFPFGPTALFNLDVGDELNLRVGGAELDGGVPNEALPEVSLDLDVGTPGFYPGNTLSASNGPFSYSFDFNYTVL